jgi:hypothetical protein
VYPGWRAAGDQQRHAAELGQAGPRRRRRRAGADHRRADPAARAGMGGPGAAPGERDPEDGVGLLRGGARPPTEEFGVEPIRRVLREHGLPIAPSTYRAAKTRPLSARAARRGRPRADPRRARRPRDRPRPVWRAQGACPAAPRGRRGRPAGLAAAGGAAQARRRATGSPPRPDLPDHPPGCISSGMARPPELVQRDFTAPAPNRLWLVDFTYVPTWTEGRSPPSSRTRSAVASSAGARPRRCPPSYPSTHWRWRCGPGSEQVRTSPA